MTNSPRKEGQLTADKLLILDLIEAGNKDDPGLD